MVIYSSYSEEKNNSLEEKEGKWLGEEMTAGSHYY